MKNSVDRKFYRKKRFLIPAILILGLVVFRIFLPTIVKNYVNKVLSDIPSYYGHVEDIDIALIRGAYVINGLYLNKVNAETQVPFLNFPQTDISIEWRSLFKGHIVSEIYMTKPEVIYVQEDMETSDTVNEEDWTKALTDIVPLEINHFEITDGKIAFVEISADPNIDLQLNQLDFVADNLRNVKAKEHTLPSSISGNASVIGNGQLSVNGKVNIIKEVPDMDVAVSVEKINLPALNAFTSHYANVDFEKGDLGLFTELAIADGFLKGYSKVMVKNSKFIGKDEAFSEKLWEGFVGFFRFVLKNQKTDTFAVKAPLEGDLNNIQTGVVPMVMSIFRNAFVKAFQIGVDEEIEYQDAFQDENNDENKGKSKWWQFWKKKKQKKAEQKEASKEELAIEK